MSFQAMTWAVDIDLPTNQKMVLLMLANRTNQDTGQCNPSHKRLSNDCGMSISTLKRCIKQLEKGGFLSIISKKNGDVNLPNQYKLNMNGVGSHRAHPSSHRPEGVGSHRPTKQEDLNQEVNNQEYNHKNKQNAQAHTSLDHNKVFEHWQNVHGKQQAKLIKNRLSKINARFKEGYTVDQLKLAIDGCKLSGFHMGENDKGTPYNDLTTILRDGAQVEKFIGLVENPPKQPARTGYLSNEQLDYSKGVKPDGTF